MADEEKKDLLAEELRKRRLQVADESDDEELDDFDEGHVVITPPPEPEKPKEETTKVNTIFENLTVGRNKQASLQGAMQRAAQQTKDIEEDEFEDDIEEIKLPDDKPQAETQNKITETIPKKKIDPTQKVEGQKISLSDLFAQRSKTSTPSKSDKTTEKETATITAINIEEESTVIPDVILRHPSIAETSTSQSNLKKDTKEEVIIGTDAPPPPPLDPANKTVMKEPELSATPPKPERAQSEPLDAFEEQARQFEAAEAQQRDNASSKAEKIKFQLPEQSSGLSQSAIKAPPSSKNNLPPIVPVPLKQQEQKREATSEPITFQPPLLSQVKAGAHFEPYKKDNLVHNRDALNKLLDNKDKIFVFREFKDNLNMIYSFRLTDRLREVFQDKEQFNELMTALKYEDEAKRQEIRNLTNTFLTEKTVEASSAIPKKTYENKSLKNYHDKRQATIIEAMKLIELANKAEQSNLSDKTEWLNKYQIAYEKVERLSDEMDELARKVIEELDNHLPTDPNDYRNIQKEKINFVDRNEKDSEAINDNLEEAHDIIESVKKLLLAHVASAQPQEPISVVNKKATPPPVPADLADELEKKHPGILFPYGREYVDSVSKSSTEFDPPSLLSDMKKGASFKPIPLKTHSNNSALEKILKIKNESLHFKNPTLEDKLLPILTFNLTNDLREVLKDNELFNHLMDEFEIKDDDRETFRNLAEKKLEIKPYQVSRKAARKVPDEIQTLLKLSEEKIILCKRMEDTVNRGENRNEDNKALDELIARINDLSTNVGFNEDELDDIPHYYDRERSIFERNELESNRILKRIEQKWNRVKPVPPVQNQELDKPTLDKSILLAELLGEIDRLTKGRGNSIKLLFKNPAVYNKFIKDDGQLDKLKLEKFFNDLAIISTPQEYNTILRGLGIIVDPGTTLQALANERPRYQGIPQNQAGDIDFFKKQVTPHKEDQTSATEAQQKVPEDKPESYSFFNLPKDIKEAEAFVDTVFLNTQIFSETVKALREKDISEPGKEYLVGFLRAVSDKKLKEIGQSIKTQNDLDQMIACLNAEWRGPLLKFMQQDLKVSLDENMLRRSFDKFPPTAESYRYRQPVPELTMFQPNSTFDLTPPSFEFKQYDYDLSALDIMESFYNSRNGIQYLESLPLNMNTFISTLKRLTPEDQLNVIAKLNDTKWDDLISTMKRYTDLADLLQYMSPTQQVEFFNKIPVTQLEAILDNSVALGLFLQTQYKAENYHIIEKISPTHILKALNGTGADELGFLLEHIPEEERQKTLDSIAEQYINSYLTDPTRMTSFLNVLFKLELENKLVDFKNKIQLFINNPTDLEIVIKQASIETRNVLIQALGNKIIDIVSQARNADQIANILIHLPINHRKNIIETMGPDWINEIVLNITDPKLAAKFQAFIPASKIVSAVSKDPYDFSSFKKLQNYHKGLSLLLNSNENISQPKFQLTEEESRRPRRNFSDIGPSQSERINLVLSENVNQKQMSFDFEAILNGLSPNERKAAIRMITAIIKQDHDIRGLSFNLSQMNDTEMNLIAEALKYRDDKHYPIHNLHLLNGPGIQLSDVSKWVDALNILPKGEGRLGIQFSISEKEKDLMQNDVNRFKEGNKIYEKILTYSGRTKADEESQQFIKHYKDFLSLKDLKRPRPLEIPEGQSAITDKSSELSPISPFTPKDNYSYNPPSTTASESSDPDLSPIHKPMSPVSPSLNENTSGPIKSPREILDQFVKDVKNAIPQSTFKTSNTPLDKAIEQINIKLQIGNREEITYKEASKLIANVGKILPPLQKPGGSNFFNGKNPSQIANKYEKEIQKFMTPQVSPRQKT